MGGLSFALQIMEEFIKGGVTEAWFRAAQKKGLLRAIFNCDPSMVDMHELPYVLGTTKQPENRFLVDLPTESPIVIPACTGERCLADIENISELAGIFGLVDNEFKNPAVNIGRRATMETPVRFCRIVQNTTLAKLLAITPHETEKLLLTQDQILSFLGEEKLRLYLHYKRTLFLFESDGKPYVVMVYPESRIDKGRSQKISITLLPFDPNNIWVAIEEHRLVIPDVKKMGRSC